jgi:hypothetical protein
MEVVYSRERRPLKRGQRFQNPRFFDGVISGATKVRLDGHYPRIVEAYAAAGVQVLRTDALTVTSPTEKLPPHEPGAVVIPEDWQELPWTQRTGDDGPTLRALASAISDAPVINKSQAIEVIEAELKRRA